ncbi:MAG TPA: hypothetical protein VIM70_01595 [Clostridium sp.]|uniref:hypothetical protein n=1 Tax=Clostridium sp. TaxID=1506 RepID=UPI002F9356E4
MTPTPYSDIYDLFSGMTSDYEFLSLSSDIQNEILEGWLLSSIGEFSKCKIDLSDRDKVLKQFNLELTDKEKGILAKLLVVEWLNPKLYTIENLRNNLSSKDFSMFSPANLLKEIRQTHTLATVTANRMITSYLHSNFDPKKDLGL